jgi:hypothetical protein
MSAYIKLATLEYPFYQGDIRLEHPEIGEIFECPTTYAPVKEILFENSGLPEIDGNTQTIYELPPVNSNGVWSMSWAVRALTQEELSVKAQMTVVLNTDAAGSKPNVIG